MPNSEHSIQSAVRRTVDTLLADRNKSGHWEGFLSSSALSTATAVTALALIDEANGRSDHQANVQSGLQWLAKNANKDGGWGDTILSLSNLSTTVLCWAAFGMDRSETFTTTVKAAEQWLQKTVGSFEPDELAKAIVARYGKDRTFSVPILTHCALAGKLGEGKNAWKQVIPLPFELAACPHQWFAALKLPVVSYALPALIAIGQVRHHHAPSRNPIIRFIRHLAKGRTLKILKSIQPDGGGFLEATPLTSFVVMSLSGCGHHDHPVAVEGVQFLHRSQREDGSWPIDTNLSTWVTTLGVNALGDQIPAADRSRVLHWLLGQQYKTEHPYTHAAPGGWAWTDLPGGVPDADDTSGALIALKNLATDESVVKEAAVNGIQWLLGLQNHDGGIPTFCRGWGALPFDQSSADITAHAIRAWATWFPKLPDNAQYKVTQATRRAIKFLLQSQATDGTWKPLWFGNQYGRDDANPMYGTAKVLHAFAELQDCATGLNLDLPTQQATRESSEGAAAWMMGAQNADGSWGGGPGIQGSVEETALALESLAEWLRRSGKPEPQQRIREAIKRGSTWLIKRVDADSWQTPAPIGFYFAKLWYYEKVYPVVWTVAALRACEALELKAPTSPDTSSGCSS